MGRRDGDTAIDVLIDVGQRPGIQGGFHFGNEGSEVRQMQQTSVDGLSECSFAQTDETLVESALPGSVLRDEVPGDVVVGGVGSDAVVPLTFEHWLDGCGRSQKAHRGVREERDAEPWRWPRRAMVAKFIVGWGVASSREGPSSRISISLRRAARSAPISHSVVPWSRVSCCLVVAGSLSRRIGTRQSPYELAVRPAASNPRT